MRVPATTTLIPNSTILLFVQQPFISGLFLVAVAYLLGVLVFILSRFLVDTVSEHTFRPILLKLFLWKEFTNLPSEINSKYRKKIEEVLKLDEGNSFRREVLVRRQRGRLLRTLVIPLMLLSDPSLDALMLLVYYFCFVIVYSYSELAIYQEARLAV